MESTQPSLQTQPLNPPLYLFQVLDDRRKWWKVQDQRGQKGYVPYNILTPHPGPRGGCSLVSRGRLLGPEGRGARGSDPENKGRGG